MSARATTTLQLHGGDAQAAIENHSVASDTPEHGICGVWKQGVVDLAICEVAVPFPRCRRNIRVSWLAGHINRPVGETRTFHSGDFRLYPGAEAR